MKNHHPVAQAQAVVAHLPLVLNQALAWNLLQAVQAVQAVQHLLYLTNPVQA